MVLAWQALRKGVDKEGQPHGHCSAQAPFASDGFLIGKLGYHHNGRWHLAG